MIINESGISLNIPADSFPFRFEDCESYIKIKGQSVTEMDVCWLKTNNGTQELWMLELKQLFDRENPLFKEQNISSAKVYKHYLDVFYRNVWHTVSMLAQNRAKTQTCITADSRFNFETVKIRVLFILNIQPNLSHYLLAFQNDLKQKLRDAIAIFNITSMAVLSYDDAKVIMPAIFPNALD